MNRLAIFLAGILLGLFFGRFYPLAHAPLPDPFAVHAPDNDDESWPLCEEVAKVQHDSRQVKASQPWPSSAFAKPVF